MRHSNNSPQVHAGSMADIAFLLLIFFLVTTTIPNDKGIIRGLPAPCPPNQKCDIRIPERNVIRILANEKGELLINNERSNLVDLRIILKEFIDNNGDGSCAYCNGKKLKTASDKPQEAAISIDSHRNAPYSSFIAIQDEITKAYYELREVYAQEKFQKKVEELSKEELKEVQEAYPFVISEADIK